MNNWFTKFWRKKGEKPSYEEIEKLLISSPYTPMKPTSQFAASLKEKLFNAREKFSQNPGSFLRRLVPTVVAALLILIAGSFFYLRGPNVFSPESLPVVKAGAESVPVNFPIRLNFSYEITPENLQKYFKISPEALGQASIKDGVLTFDHEKFLAYGTEYRIDISKDAAPGMSEDFGFMFRTRPRFQASLYLGAYIDAAFSNVNFYDSAPQVKIILPGSGAFTANVFKVSPEAVIDYMAAAEKNFIDGKENKAIERYKPLMANPIFTVQIAERGKKDEFFFKPDLPDAGMYFVEFAGKSQSKWDDGHYRFFLTNSRYAITSRRLGSKLVTWVVDTKTATGVPNAPVQGLDGKKNVLFTGKTNVQGFFEWLVPTDPKEQPSYLVAETGDEKLFQLLRARYMNIFDEGFFWGSFKPSKEYRGFVMTDAPLYSPGGKVQFKAMVRKIDEINYSGSLKKVHVEAIRDRYGEALETIFKGDFDVSDMGTFSGEIPLSRELRTGTYQIVVTLDGQAITREEFGVEIFQKPDFEVSIKPESAIFISGDTVTATVNANYYFGEPVKGAPVTVEVVSSYYYSDVVAKISGTLDENGRFTAKIPNVRINKDTYYGYSSWRAREGYPFTIRAKVTENTGKSVLKNAAVKIFPAEYRVEREIPKNIWNLKPRESIPFVIRVKENLAQGGESGVPDVKVDIDINKRTWENRTMRVEDIKSFSVTTDSFGKAEFEQSFERGGSYDIQYRVTDPRGNSVDFSDHPWIPDLEYGVYYDDSRPESKMQIMILPDKETYRMGETARVTAYLPQQEGSVFLSVNTGSMRRVWTEKISKAEASFNIPLTEDLVPGFHLSAEVYNGDNFFTGAQYIEVAGKKLIVEIKTPNKKPYPKEDITLEVSAKDEDGNPVATEGALTVVDKAILALRHYSDVTLFDTFYPKPNEWSMRRMNTIDPFVIGAGEMGGCFLAGTRILMVDGSTKAIEDIVKGDQILTRASDYSDKLVKDRVVRTFEHTVKEYLVINGWLNVTDIHRIFVNGKWTTAGKIKVGDWLIGVSGERIQVTSLEKVVNRVKVYNFETERLHTYFADGVYVHNDKGGDDARPRTEFVDVAYWYAFVQTGSDGKGEAKFTLPDNLTTWVALSKNITKDTQVGEGEGEFVVSKDLFVRPILPLFVRTGDTLALPASIHNTTDKSLNTRILLKATGATITGNSIYEKSVAPFGIAQVNFELHVDEVKELKLEFSLSQIGGTLVDNTEHRVPIYPSLTPNTVTYTDVSPATLEFPFLKKNNPDSAFAKATLSLSSSIVSVLPEVIEKLTGYPYGCVEQTMSKHLPNIFVKKGASMLGISPPADLDKKIQEGFDRLQMFQSENGSFGWWEGDEANIWMTGYVLEGFLQIREIGLLSGREKMYERTFEYLKGRFPKLEGDEKIYAWYVLSRAKPKEFTLKLSDEELGKLQPEFLGYAALGNFLNGRKNEAERIVKEYILKQMKDNHWEQTGEPKDGHDMQIADKYLATGVNLMALMAIGGADETEIRAIVSWLMNHRNGYQGLWGSTRQSSQILSALIQFIDKYSEFDPDLEYTVMLNGEELKNGKANSKKFSKKIVLPAKKLKAENTLAVTSSGKGNLYAALGVVEYVRTAAISGQSGELDITRAYFKDGQEAAEFSVGDVVEVRIQVHAQDRDLRYVLVEDKLPAGFSVINDRLKKAEFEEGFEGRSRWYWNGANVDIRDERVTFFDTYFSARGETYKYRARVTHSGTFAVPAPRVEPMYEPQTFANGKESKVEVK